MKLLFASDIHGSAKDCENLKRIFEEEKADQLILCGDLLYHGPRNDLPESYNPKQVIETLNSLSENIIAVRGNCDSEVDQMVLSFNLLCDYSVLYVDGIRMYVTHGHVYNKENPFKFNDNDVLICGHTHVLAAEKVDNYYYLNPGSVSIPKEENDKTYMIYENRCFAIKNFEGKVIKTLRL